jgi:hypothetical protein
MLYIYIYTVYERYGLIEIIPYWLYRYGLWCMTCPNLVYLSYSYHGWMTRIEVYHGDWKSYRSNVGIPMNSMRIPWKHGIPWTILASIWEGYNIGNNIGNNIWMTWNHIGIIRNEIWWQVWVLDKLQRSHIATSLYMIDGRLGATLVYVPSGYLTVCHGTSSFLIGKPSISMGHGFHGYVK